MGQSQQPVRVLVVEDHELVREGIERRLNAAGGYVIVAMATDAAEAARALEAHPVDLVLVDHTLPDGDGMDVLRSARAFRPGAKVVVLSAQDEPEVIAGYLRAGADGYAHKTVNAAELQRVLAEAVSGGRGLDAVATKGLVHSLEHPAPPPEASSRLSPRELQVLELVAAGHTNDDIAQALFISPQTVKTHLSRIFDKLGVRDRASATAVGMRSGVLA
jgi:DNA-binding NarL/FixJ family response regulator